jgi:DNA-binding response OmpR family regulator
MKVNNMPATMLPAGKIRVLIADSDDNAASALANTLRTRADYEVQIARNNFQTGIIAQKFAPHVLLINLLAEGIDAADICKSIRSNEDLQTTKVVALANQLSESESAALMQKGFDACVSNPANIAKVIKEIEETTAIIY